jgi:hypothetical protein
MRTLTEQNANASDTWGDIIDNKNKTDYRCCFQNINGLGVATDDPKRESLRNFIQDYDVDFFLMAEINVNWRIVSKRSSMHDMTRGWFETQRVRTSFNRHCRTCHQYQPGGTAIITRDKPALHYESSGEDSRYLGRWSWQRFTGKKGLKLRVISVYFPTRSSTYGHKKVYDQQQRGLLNMGITTEVHKMFWKDFWKMIDAALADGERLIIGGDWNMKITCPTLRRNFAKRNLLPAISGRFSTPPPPTFNRASRYAIDEIFASADIIVSKAGYLPFGTGVGDHRPIWFDFTIASSMGHTLPKLTSFPSRKLKCHDPAIQKRYLKLLTKFLKKHDVFQRSEILFSSIHSPMLPNEIIEYENLDRLRTKGMEQAENKCRHLFMGGRDWSPILQHARDVITYLTLCLSKANKCHVNTRTLIRAARKAGTCAEFSSVSKLRSDLSAAHGKYKELRKQHRELRYSFIEALAQRLEDDGKGPRASILRNLLSMEKQRELFRKLKFYNKPSDSKAITELTVTNAAGDRVVINDKEQMESYMGAENVRKYHQTEDTCPFFSHPLRSDFGDLATGPAVASVLDGSYEPDPSTDQYTKDFLSVCKLTDHAPATLSRQAIDFKRSWGKMKEKTSSRDLHFGHFQTGVQHDDILHLHYNLAEIPYRTGYSPKRWQQATQLMILKKPGLTDVERLRTLVLFEADFNHNNKFFGKSVMNHMQKHSLVAKEQYSAPGKKCIDHVLNRRLLFDVTRYSKQCLGLNGCDLASCYDRVTHTPAMLALASYGIPLEPMYSMFDTIQHCNFYIRTAFGDSVRSFGGHDPTFLALPMGLGQGNGSGPTVWSVVSSKMFEVLYKRDLASFFMTPISALPLDICGFAFVDDTDLICTIDRSANSTSTLDRMQTMVDCWEGVARTTGGAIETSPEKSWWYLVDFSMKNGSWSYIDHSDDPSMKLTCRNKEGIRDTLTYVPPQVATKMLGVYLAPNGDESFQLQTMRDQARLLAHKFGPAPLDQYAAWTVLNSIAHSKLRYPLPATTFSEKSWNSIFWPVLNVLLPKCAIARRFPRALLYGPGSILGLNLPSLFLQQGIHHVSDIVDHLWHTDVTGHFIRSSIENLHLELGFASFSFALDVHLIKTLVLTESWIVETLKFMSQHNISINLGFPEFPLRRQHDSFLMTALYHSTIPRTQWKSFNKCRIFLQVLSLADICTGNGTSIRSSCFKGIFDPGSSRNGATWPSVPRPLPRDWKIWQSCLIHLFCVGTSLQLLTRLGMWYSTGKDTWAWFIHVDSTHLVRQSQGGKEIFLRVGRSRIAPRFSKISAPTVDMVPHHYARTSVLEFADHYRSEGFAVSCNHPAPPSPSIPSFDWLHFRVQRTDVISTLLNDLQAHKATMVTDGSYHPHEYTGSAAWTIESADGSEYITGISLPPGPPSLQSAPRSELVGILAIVSYLHRLLAEFSLPSAGGQLGCDCRGALESTFHSFRPLSSAMKNSDILSSISHYLKSPALFITPVHVYAHLDDIFHYKDLTRMERSNVRMDYLAKKARIEYANELHHHSRLMAVPFAFAPVTVGGVVVSDTIKSSLYHHLSSKIAKDYWTKKGVLSEQTMHLIYFPALERASNLAPLSRRIFISKWASGHIGTGKVVVRNQYRHDGACPFCLHPLEDTAHILDCHHDEALTSWNKSLWIFATSLHKAHFPVEFIIAIKRELTAMRYRHVPPRLAIYPAPIRSMIRQQRLIGWNQFLLGFIPLTWKHHFLQILKDAKLLRRFSPDLWASKLIRASWGILHSVWIARNDKLFNTSRILDLSGQQILFRAIKNERAIGLSNLPTCDFSRLLSITLPALLSKPLAFLKDWFVTVRSGRILYSDRLLLTDKFTTDLSLQRWVGLSPIIDNDSDVEFSDHG